MTKVNSIGSTFLLFPHLLLCRSAVAYVATDICYYILRFVLRHICVHKSIVFWFFCLHILFRYICSATIRGAHMWRARFGTYAVWCNHYLANRCIVVQAQSQQDQQEWVEAIKVERV